MCALRFCGLFNMSKTMLHDKPLCGIKVDSMRKENIFSTLVQSLAWSVCDQMNWVSSYGSASSACWHRWDINAFFVASVGIRWWRPNERHTGGRLDTPSGLIHTEGKRIMEVEVNSAALLLPQQVLKGKSRALCQPHNSGPSLDSQLAAPYATVTITFPAELSSRGRSWRKTCSCRSMTEVWHITAHKRILWKGF